MSNVSSIMLIVRCLTSAVPQCFTDDASFQLLGGSQDMASAYRQVPLPGSQLAFAITAVLNPRTRNLSLRKMFGQPVGAGHPVPNFYRLAVWLCRVGHR
eukprot:8033634-Heterocapsa_arctica.AAC.1